MSATALLNPFPHISRSTALVGAVVALVALFGLSLAAGVHLDGALDLHYNPQHHPTAGLLAAESALAWLSLALCGWLAARLFGGAGKVADYLVYTAITRAPMLAVAALGGRWLLGARLGDAMQIQGAQITLDMTKLMDPVIILLSLALIPFLVWMLAWLVLGIKQASGLSGGKLAGAAIVGIILAEIVSKLALLPIFRAGL